MSRVNFRPPMIAIALGKAHHTNRGIRSAKAFSVNEPGRDSLEKVDHCGLVSGKSVDKSGLFTVTRAPVTGAPMADDCRLCMERRQGPQAEARPGREGRVTGGESSRQTPGIDDAPPGTGRGPGALRERLSDR